MLHVTSVFKKKFFHRYGISILLVAILLLGAFLRLYRISEYMTFLGDEGRDALVVKRMIVDHKFTLLGPTSSVGGFFLGPIYYYFMAPFLWLWRLDPTGPAVMVGLFGVATIYLVYRVGKDFFSKTVGLIAASVYALSPVVIAYSRSSWNPNLVPFFSLLTIYLCWRIIVKKRYHEFFYLGVACGIGLQLHYVFLFLCPVIGGWFLILGRKKELIRYYMYGIIGFIVGFSPFLAFELRHSFPNSRSIIQFLLVGDETGYSPASFGKNIADVSLRIVGRLVYRLPQPEIYKSFTDSQMNIWFWTIRLTLLFSFALLAKHIWRGWKKEEKTSRSSFLLLFWFFTIITLFGFYRKGIYDYYFGIFFTLPFYLFALIVEYLLRKKYLWVLGVSIWAGVLWFNWQGRPFLYSPNNQYGQAREISKVALEKTEGRPFNFALVTGGNSDHVYRYFFEIWNNPPVVIQNTDIDPNRDSVTDQLIVICEMECQPLGHSLWEIAGFGRASIVGSWDVPFVRIYKLVPYNESDEKQHEKNN